MVKVAEATRTENLVCTLCGSPVDWREAEQVYRHTGPVSDDRYIAQTVCDKYGYPVEAVRAKEEPNA